MNHYWMILGLIFTALCGYMAYQHPTIAIAVVAVFDGLSITWVIARGCNCKGDDNAQTNTG